jgi:hypothetical protein
MRVWTIFLLSFAALAQDTTPQPGIPVRMVLTAEPHHSKDKVPVISQQDVAVQQGKEKPKIIDWQALQNDRATLQLAILIDDGTDTELGIQFNDLRQFIESQPSTTQVAVGYMRNGTVMETQGFTQDHAKAAKALRLPLGSGSINASPYVSLSDFVKRWPESNVRREVLMISSGIDPLYPSPDIQDPYLDQAIEQCQRAGILVHSIYYSMAGHFGHSFWRNSWGQNYLSKLADGTGGEAYWQGFTNPVSFDTFLKDLSQRLQNQYLITFRALASNSKKGSFERVKFSTELPNVELIGAERVYVPADR